MIASNTAKNSLSVFGTLKPSSLKMSLLFSVILKKANKEYLARIGETLDNNYELVEVLPNTAVFRNGQKIVRIEIEEIK